MAAAHAIAPNTTMAVIPAEPEPDGDELAARVDATAERAPPAPPPPPPPGAPPPGVAVRSIAPPAPDGGVTCGTSGAMNGVPDGTSAGAAAPLPDDGAVACGAPVSATGVAALVDSVAGRLPEVSSVPAGAAVDEAAAVGALAGAAPAGFAGWLTVAVAGCVAEFVLPASEAEGAVAVGSVGVGWLGPAVTVG
jgi:hypothetical protein